MLTQESQVVVYSGVSNKILLLEYITQVVFSSNEYFLSSFFVTTFT